MAGSKKTQSHHVSRREIVRTSVQFRDENPSSYRYRGCFTLEPPLVGDAWDTLAEDTFGLEIADYPRILHHAFLAEVLKRAGYAKT